MVMRSRATEGRSASRCQQKWPDQPPRPPFGVPGFGRRPRRQAVLSKRGNSAKNPPRFGVHLGNPGLHVLARSTPRRKTYLKADILALHLFGISQDFLRGHTASQHHFDASS